METLKKIVLGFGICVLAFLVYAVPVAERGREAAGSLADEFYNRYSDGDFAYIRSRLLSAGLRAELTPEDLAAARRRTGRLKGRRRVSFKLLKLDGSRLYLRFEADYENIQSLDQFYLAREDGELRLTSAPNAEFCRQK